MVRQDLFHAKKIIETPVGTRSLYHLNAFEAAGLGDVTRLPYCIKVLLEACLRHYDGMVVTEQAVRALASYQARNVGEVEIPFMPGRVVLQDFTGVPAVVDLAAMRSAIVRMTGDPESARKVNPLVPCDLVIDHSVQVDAFASGLALSINSEKEFERNQERYAFLKWGQSAFDNFRVVPPATGIVHQVNLEYLANVVWGANDGQGGSAPSLFPDSLVGTDSHTTMINGLGVLGWGVGGIEAEAVMLGQPIYMLIPEVVGFQLTGKLPAGATATDLVLMVTEMLRNHGVVGKFVEFFGSGLDQMPVSTRATIANMAPEYGATVGYFPIDEQTIQYLELTGRDAKLIQLVEQYCKLQGLWRDDDREIEYTDVLTLDLSMVEPSLAGPKRPQDRIALSTMKNQWDQDLSTTFGKSSPSTSETMDHGIGDGGQAATATVVADLGVDGVVVSTAANTFPLKHGAVVIAAITSCTNTSNPEVMIGAGLLARQARSRGLTSKPWVKTSLAPGSKVVTEYLNKAGLMSDLEAMGFYLVGYGCTTCIGNSGPLSEPISQAIIEHDLVVASVLSGNRNFEGRIHQHVKANYLASPPLVVAYAIAGTVDIDLTRDPLGTDEQGEPVYLKDIWPSSQQITQLVGSSVGNDQFINEYANVFEGSDDWRAIQTSGGANYAWEDESTYIQEPPFFTHLRADPAPIGAIRGARCLLKLGDSVTTDHISPAGAIKQDSPAGRYLLEQGVPVSMFNTYGSRRGNDRVMTRGTFANVRVRNELAPGTEGGWTTFLGVPPGRDDAAKSPDGQGAEVGRVMSIYDAAMLYETHRIPLVVLAGKDPELTERFMAADCGCGCI